MALASRFSLIICAKILKTGLFAGGLIGYAELFRDDSLSRVVGYFGCSSADSMHSGAFRALLLPLIQACQTIEDLIERFLVH
tara:strand:+ start:568 stop:813 length:246 start_codon:yes stop_codon:yes gene_type:complete